MDQTTARELLKRTLGPGAEFREGQWEAIDQVANLRCWRYNCDNAAAGRCNRSHWRKPRRAADENDELRNPKSDK